MIPFIFFAFLCNFMRLKVRISSLSILINFKSTVILLMNYLFNENIDIPKIKSLNFICCTNKNNIHCLTKIDFSIEKQSILAESPSTFSWSAETLEKGKGSLVDLYRREGRYERHLLYVIIQRGIVSLLKNLFCLTTEH